MYITLLLLFHCILAFEGGATSPLDTMIYDDDSLQRRAWVDPFASGTIVCSSTTSFLSIPIFPPLLENAEQRFAAKNQQTNNVGGYAPHSLFKFISPPLLPAGWLSCCCLASSHA